MNTAVDLVEDGEDVVDELVDEGVEDVIGAAAEQLLAFGFIYLAAVEGGGEGLEAAVVHGDDEVAADEDIDFAGAG